jgi:hypothetical protein
MFKNTRSPRPCRHADGANWPTCMHHEIIRIVSQYLLHYARMDACVMTFFEMHSRAKIRVAFMPERSTREDTFLKA